MMVLLYWVFKCNTLIRKLWYVFYERISEIQLVSLPKYYLYYVDQTWMSEWMK